MLLPAYIPSWWFALMDPKVLEHYDGDITKANLDPQRRDELLAKYGQPSIDDVSDVEETTATAPPA